MERDMFFAVYRDGGDRPVAMFSSFEDAFDWACARFECGAFRLKRWQGHPVPALPALDPERCS
jgi:hypothetical protein